ncbi:MAG: tetratricopeptide repeat protein [Firmicutes bacterium]|nr:tetratricopeptide repeat protein [Bacillota bacterium]
MALNREDYAEPACPFETDQWKSEPQVRTIPVSRVIEKLDEFYGRSDYSGAVRLVDYWLAEAEAGKDLRGQFALRNELMGIYRKTGKKDEAIENAELALQLVKDMEAEGSVSEGTALVNAATVYKAFGMPEKSAELFVRAKSIYESSLPPADPRLGGLYNNMGLTLVDLGEYKMAREFYEKALYTMRQTQGTQAEQAVTYLNIADLLAAEKGMEEAENEISSCCRAAIALLDSRSIKRDGNYAFFCEKCAPVLDYYGFFAAAEELFDRALNWGK